jgi:hypothetical protein
LFEIDFDRQTAKVITGPDTIYKRLRESIAKTGKTITYGDVDENKVEGRGGVVHKDIFNFDYKDAVGTEEEKEKWAFIRKQPPPEPESK